jgi:hypothetical protein
MSSSQVVSKRSKVSHTDLHWFWPPVTCDGCGTTEQAVVLVVGSGGREHAIADKLAESRLVARVLVAPGNAGTATAGGKISNVAIAAEDIPNLVAFAR